MRQMKCDCVYESATKWVYLCGTVNPPNWNMMYRVSVELHAENQLSVRYLY